MKTSVFTHMVHEYYVNRLKRRSTHFEQRIFSLSTRQEAEAYCSNSLKKLQQCFGPLPERTPLRPRSTEKIDRERYTIENVYYESRPGYYVTANLYLPAGRGPFPAVLGSCGHAKVGKAAANYQAFARGLVTQGFVVLVYDPVGQGERMQFSDRPAAAPSPIPTHEHNMLGRQMSLLGEFFGTWRLWDGIRSLDYLLSRPEVDPTRVGVTGNSGGGTLSSYLNALDERFTMAAPSCFITTFLHNLENELPTDAEQVPPSILEHGLDMADFILARAPRPVLLLGQEQDFFDVRGLRKTYQYVQHVYRLLDAPDAVRLFVGDSHHGFWQSNRQAMYEFFMEVSGVKAPPTEPETAPEPPEVLFAAPEGQVHRIHGHRFCHEIVGEMARKLADGRGHRSPENLQELLPRILNLPERTTVPHHRVRRPQFNIDIGRFRTIWHFSVETEPGILALVQLWDDRDSSDETAGHIAQPPALPECTVCVPHLTSLEDVERELLPQLPRQFFSVEVRGLGQTIALIANRPQILDIYGADYMHAAQGQMLDESYFGRRAHDLLSTLDMLEAVGNRQIHLVGRGLGAILAAIAGFLHPAVSRVTLKDTLLSFHELTQVPASIWPMSSLPRSILQHVDLPDVYRALRKKNLSLIEPWNFEMQHWEPEALRRQMASLDLDLDMLEHSSKATSSGASHQESTTVGEPSVR
jgi:dienelactone hydrolase/pimeloyl-ACP methyl ester carboxylesterase